MMIRKTSVVMLLALICGPALAQIPAVKRAGIVVLQSLDTEYTAYDQALDAQKAAVADEKQKYDALVAAQAALDAATAARDQAQTELDAAKQVTNDARDASNAAHDAVRP